MPDARVFYDSYAGRQLAAGTNERHSAIDAWLQRFGLCNGMRVLELGCGVGTQTELIARRIGAEGRVVAVDFSRASVAHAKRRIAERAPDARVHLIVADITAFSLRAKFDVIVLPDVLEHIPKDRHARLFALLAACLAPGGWVLVHTPQPHFLVWCRERRKSELQIIDEPVYAEALALEAANSGLYLDTLISYSIWMTPSDYQVAILKHAPCEFSGAHRPAGPRAILLASLRRALRRCRTVLERRRT